MAGSPRLAAFAIASRHELLDRERCSPPPENRRVRPEPRHTNRGHVAIRYLSQRVTPRCRLSQPPPPGSAETRPTGRCARNSSTPSLPERPASPTSPPGGRRRPLARRFRPRLAFSGRVLVFDPLGDGAGHRRQAVLALPRRVDPGLLADHVLAVAKRRPARARVRRGHVRWFDRHARNGHPAGVSIPGMETVPRGI